MSDDRKEAGITKTIREEDIEFDRFDWKRVKVAADWDKAFIGDIHLKQRMPKPLEVNNETKKRQASAAKSEVKTKKIVQRRYNISMKKLKSHHRNK